MNKITYSLLFLLFLPLKLVLGQTINGKLNVSVSNCLNPQTFRLYSLEKEQLLLDETNVSGTHEKEEFSLNLDKLTNWEEPRYLLSISPLGMDIDIVICKTDSIVNMIFSLPSNDSEEIYTSYIEFKGSKKAQEFYNMNTDFWKKSIIAGKQRQILLATNIVKADSAQVIVFNDNIKEAVSIIDNSDNLNCVNSCFYKIVESMRTVKSYFNVKLYSKKKLQRKLEDFENKYPQSPMVQSFINDLKPIVESIQW